MWFFSVIFNHLKLKLKTCPLNKRSSCHHELSSCLLFWPTVCDQAGLETITISPTNSSSEFSFNVGKPQRFEANSVTYWRWKWVTVPATFTTGIYIYETYNRYGSEETQPAKNWQVAWYRFLPLKTLSRLWGWVHDLHLPEWSRSALLSLYVNIFGCDLSEAEEEDLKKYQNLGEFFRRALKVGARPIHEDDLVSPSDGKVLHFGKIKCGEIEQVKGVAYSLPEFIGLPTWKQENNEQAPEINPQDPSLLLDCDKYSSYISERKDTSLYHLVVYLAPGDYHRFHSPADWTVHFRRHFAGDLLSVSPLVARLVRGLFSLNERVVYVGQWRHGFFSYTAVGATNVGSIRIYIDEELKTNYWKNRKGTQFEYTFPQPLDVRKGDVFGEFNLGSTIVIIFEAPNNVEFSVKSGDRILVGKPFLKIAQK
ncbi:unnamed protein product [Allacma fusca]|uniref:Phosphatidylserine decarboxylase proenzyme, mitochondrial n=1 Tax=Allacma fusca TaxID=39272 RepID=A0A8J2KHE7_9HEXA|nr:unnamed protein product [Allacma fusca]